MPTALVTGCSSGIGYSIAKELAKRGWKVFACARRVDPMKSLVEEYPDQITIFSLDVSSEESLDKGVEFVKQGIPDGKLDLLYNNAGSSCTLPAVDVPDAALSQCMAVNVEGPIKLTTRCIRMLIKAQGTVAFTGSLAGIVPFPWGAVYSASKAAIHTYANALAFEMEPFNVRVVNFVTGGVNTNIADTRPIPKGGVFDFEAARQSLEMRQKMAVKNHPMEPEEYARKAVDAVVGSKVGKVNVYLGTMATTMSWVVTLVPRWLLTWGLRIKFNLNSVWEVIRKSKTE